MPANDLLEIPPVRRLRYLRQLAADARQEARESDNNTVRNRYSTMAELWDRLADDTEKRLADTKVWVVDRARGTA
jgi:hypothetical protein